jgi:relaxin family peptide receptor 2
MAETKKITHPNRNFLTFKLISTLLSHHLLSPLIRRNLDGIGFGSIDFEAVARIDKLQYIVYKKFYYCSMTRHVKKCKPHTDGVSSFNNLLEKPVLRFSAWVMALFTFFGNGLVLWGRYTFHDENRAVSMVIRNLAVADLLMGVYLFIIGAQDLRFRQTYNLHAKDWVVSWNCAITGIVALVSSEVSVFILAFMSVERFLLISDPFGGHRRLNAKNMLVCLFSIWMLGITMAVVPLIHYRSSTKFYGTYSGTCFPLLLHLELGWQYSAFLFLGVNMSLLVLIAALYTALLVSIWRTRRATPLALLDFEFAIR